MSPWKEQLRRWTQDLYFACLADYNIPSKTKSDDIRAIVRKYNTFPAALASPPSLRTHKTRDTNRIKLKHHDYKEAKERFSFRVATCLLIDLDILLDNAVRDIMETKAIRYMDGSGIESRLSKLGLVKDNIEFAYFRVIELSAVRNCIVHNSSQWTASQINRLPKLEGIDYDSPFEGEKIEIMLPHLFAYKTAVRNVISRCQNPPNP